jgi:hypothetical protein
MGLCLVSFDLRKVRNYEALYRALEGLSAQRLLETLWLVDHAGGAADLRNGLLRHLDGDDGLAVIGLEGRFAWATYGVREEGLARLKAVSSLIGEDGVPHRA